MVNFFQVALLLHIIGLTMAAGTTLVSYILSRKFWKQYGRDKEKGEAIMQAIVKLPTLTGMGLGLQIISGIMMLAVAGGGYGQLLWFKIKLILVVVIIASTIVLNRGMQRRLRDWVLDDMTQGGKVSQIGHLAGRISYLQLILLSFFIIIFMLSVFKFN